MANLTTTGVKITVDTSDVDIKFLKSVDQLNTGLTKSQKALGLFYNEQGLLTNGLGQCVEGLTTTQIKLGEYVDELGNVRTFQGGFTEGLSKTQISLGMYADELGNIRNAIGEVVGVTEKAAKSLEKELATAAKKAAESLRDIEKSTEKTAGEIKELEGELNKGLGGVGDALKEIGNITGNKGIKDFAEYIDVIKDFPEKIKKHKETAESIKKIGKGIKEAGTATKALNAGITALGGPIGIALLAVQGITMAFSWWKQKKENELVPLNEEFKKLEENAQKAGESIKGVGDALKYGAFHSKGDEFKEAEQRVKTTEKKLEEAKKAREEAIERQRNGSAAGGMGAAGAGYSVLGEVGPTEEARVNLENAKTEYKNALAEFNGQVVQLVEKARESTAVESERLEAEKARYETVKKYATEEAADAETRAAIDKKLTQLDEQIEKAKEKEHQEALKAAGMFEYVDAAKKEQAKTAPTIQEFNETVDKWRKAVEEGTATQEELDAALKEKTKEIAATLADKYGISMEPSQTSDFGDVDLNNQFQEGQKALEESLRSGAKSLDEYAAEVDALRKRLEEERDARAAVDLKERYNAGEITADQYRALDEGLKKKNAAALEEQLKEQKDATKVIEEWKKAFNAGRVTAEAYNAAIEKATADVEAQKAEENAKKVDRLSKEIGVDIPTVDSIKEAAATRDAPAFKTFQSDSEKLNAALREGTITQEQHDAALTQLTEAARASVPGYAEAIKAKQAETTAAADSMNNYRKTVKEQLKNAEIDPKTREKVAAAQNALKELTGNDSKNVSEAAAQALEEYNNAVAAAAEAFKNGAVEKETYNALLANASENLKDALDKEAAAAQKAADEQRRSIRNDLGIDSLLEEMKTPLEKYRETLDKIEKAMESGAISGEETTLLEQKAMDDYWTKMDELSDTAQKGAEKLEKMELGKSSSSGSESLYLSMVKNSQLGYQNRIQATTGRIADLQTQTLSETQTTNALLTTIAESGINNYSVFRG